MSMVLHDWSDAEARQLLSAIKAAAPAGARLVAFELRLLLQEAGFKSEGVSATPTPVSVITALA